MASTSPAPPKTKSQHSSAKPNNPPSANSPASRHERLCSICQHPRREDIDDDILRWRSPQDIVYDFDLSDRSVVYRHARATQILSQRKQNLNPALERVIESVYDAKPSMNAVLKAMAIYARVNGNEAYKAGFTDPPRHTVITHVTTRTAGANGPVGAPPCPEYTKDAAPSTDPTPAVANGSVGTPPCPEPSKGAAPSSNPAQVATEGQGFTCPDAGRSPAEDVAARSATQGSPTAAPEGVLTSIESSTPGRELQNDDLSKAVVEQPVSEEESKIDGFTSPLLPGVVFAEGHFPLANGCGESPTRLSKFVPISRSGFYSTARC